MKKGLYYGFTPTDESAIGIGEIEILIDETGATVRLAGGLRLYTDQVGLKDFVSMSIEEILPGSDLGTRERLACKYEGFKVHVDGADGVQLIFIKRPGLRDPDILARLGMADLLGPTMLWRQGRLPYYLIKAWIWWQDYRTKGGVPLLARDGRVA